MKAPLFVVGGVAKKVFKIGRGAIKFGQIVSNLTPKLQNAADAIHTAVKARTGHENVVVEVRQRLIAEARTGKVPDDGILSKDLPSTDARHIQDKEGVIDDQPVCRSGRSCFVKGTLVSTEQGLRAIETLKAGELVWSRKETTGHTELKPIAQTFERQSATLLLTFSNGEKVETTKEHPFYVESEGFKAAGELGIGTSIVTRAGPSVALASSKEKSQTVYNFEVEDFHTYFVGNSALWVHNNNCGFDIDAFAERLANGPHFATHLDGKVNEVDGEIYDIPLRDKGIDTNAKYEQAIKDAINRANGTDNHHKSFRYIGKEYFWDDSTGMVVIFDPNGVGTAFFPKQGKAYFDDLKIRG